jgi:lipoprotein-releasing system permease protein
MFELFVAKKYLIPKRKQLSVSLIALMSIAVISLVVWLVLIFLSVTVGIEQNWLKKLTSLNAPIKIVPTHYYYNSYYHHIDTLSAASSYTHKSLKEKRLAEQTNPYNAEEDEAIPSFWPSPDLNADGSLKDPVKIAFQCFQTLKENHPELVAQDYEITGALMKLRLIRPTSSLPYHPNEQSFLTQMTYVASFSNESPFLHSLLLPPSVEDVHHLLYLSSLTLDDTTLELPQSAEQADALLLRKRLATLFDHLHHLTIHPSSHHLELNKDFFPEGRSLQVAAYRNQSKITHFLIPAKLSKTFSRNEHISSQHLLYGTLEKKQDHLYFTSSQHHSLQVDSIPLYVDEPIELQATIDQDTLKSAHSLQDVQLQCSTTLQNIQVTGKLPWSSINLSDVAISQHFDTSPTHIPVWPYFVQNTCLLPQTDATAHHDHSVLLPKYFRDSGVRIGDKGFLSYSVATASSMQEQRLPIYVAGFYDPGVMAVGAKCILMETEAVHNIATSSNSFSLDQNMTSGIQVWFKDLNQTQSIAEQLQVLFKKEGIDRYFTITTFYEYDFAKDLLQQFQSDKYLFTLIGMIILVVACSNIISFLVLMVNDKKKEIGILQSMGASPKSIALIFALCGASLGLLGSAIGTLAAYLTMHHIDSLVGLLSILQGHDAFHEHFYGQSLPSILSADAVLFILISTPILSLLAGLIPAVKASRLRPALTLRSE